MPCVRPDGKPTESGRKMLQAVQSGKKTAEDVAAATGMPLYRVRSGLREMAEAGFLSQSDGVLSLSDQGRALL